HGHKVNLLDTPGYADFVGDVHSALRAADCAILMLRANAGVEVGTEVVWEIVKQDRIPTLLVVNMMDKEHADFMGAMRSARERLDEVVDVLPSPVDAKPQTGALADGARVTVKSEPAEPAAALVFKTISEQHLGDLSLIRVYSGRLEPGKDLVNTRRNRPEKLGALYNLVGKERQDCKSAVAYEIVAAVKFKETHTGNKLADKARPVKLEPPIFPSPVTAECVRAKNKGDEEKMAQGLNRL